MKFLIKGVLLIPLILFTATFVVFPLVLIEFGGGKSKFLEDLAEKLIPMPK